MVVHHETIGHFIPICRAIPAVHGFGIALGLPIMLLKHLDYLMRTSLDHVNPPRSASGPTQQTPAVNE